jgi:C_GCAxxG_C_C family probable redox protein
MADKPSTFDLMAQGASCAEAVLAGVCPGAAPGAATGFGAGIGRLGGVCGCLTGGVLALGVRAGAREPGDEALKERVYAEARDLFRRFQVRFGATGCRELIGIDFLDDQDRVRYDAAAKARCREMAAWVVAELEPRA